VRGNIGVPLDTKYHLLSARRCRNANELRTLRARARWTHRSHALNVRSSRIVLSLVVEG
jgi:hypothetical protein